MQSAVGKTHVLRSGLVMDYTTSYFPLIVLGYPLDPKRSYGPLPDVVSLDQSQALLVPSSSYLRVYMGCALAILFQVRSLYIP